VTGNDHRASAISNQQSATSNHYQLSSNNRPTTTNMAGGGVIAKAIYNEVSFELTGLTMTLFYLVSVQYCRWF
jgi:hypothetical protein